jgi:hypothetical protein
MLGVSTDFGGDSRLLPDRGETAEEVEGSVAVKKDDIDLFVFKRWKVGEGPITPEEVTGL